MRTDIVKILGREILDSRGNPTVEAEISLQDGTIARAAAPSGASTGEFEALELRDGDPTRFGGKGVQNAVKHINTVIQSALLGKDSAQTGEIDRLLCQLDGTPDKSRLGANGLLAVSLAAARAASQALQLALYRFLGGVRANTLPLPMMNIQNRVAALQANPLLQALHIGYKKIISHQLYLIAQTLSQQPPSFPILLIQCILYGTNGICRT